MNRAEFFTAQDLILALRDPGQVERYSLSKWDRILSIARNKNLLARLAETLAATTDQGCLPEPVCIHLKSALVLSRHQKQGIQWEAQHVATALNKLEIPLIFLKGTAYVLGELPVAKGRLFGDIDILVPKSSLQAVEASLMLYGWTSSGTDAYDQRYYREWMHEIPPMLHRQRGTAIDVHHNILPTTAKNCPDIEPILADAITLPNTPFSILSPCDMVLHSSTHLFYEGEFHNGLRDLFDLDSLLCTFAADEPTFWNRLVKRAAETGLVVPLFFALRYTNIILGTTYPAGLLEEVAGLARVNPLTQTILDICYPVVLNASHANAPGFGQALATLTLYLRSHMLRMPPSLLIPHLSRKALLRMYKSSSRTN